MPTFSKDDLPGMDRFRLYQKKLLTLALRIEGPFTVETLEGPLTCRDGWLALDSRGNPYPINDEVFQDIYELAE